MNKGSFSKTKVKILYIVTVIRNNGLFEVKTTIRSDLMVYLKLL